MSTLFDTRLVALHSQHCLQSQDMLKICDLARAEGMAEEFENYSFDTFLGMVIHMLITTESQHTREQLAQQLPKFGSAAVSPLIKILYRLQTQQHIRALAQASLNKIDLYPLVIGLSQLLDNEIDTTLRSAAVQQLTELIESHNQSVLLVLPKLVSTKTWQILKLQLLTQMPYPKFNIGDCDRDLSSQPESTLNQEPQLHPAEHPNQEKFNYLCRAK